MSDDYFFYAFIMLCIGGGVLGIVLAILNCGVDEKVNDYCESLNYTNHGSIPNSLLRKNDIFYCYNIYWNRSLGDYEGEKYYLKYKEWEVE